MTMITDLPIEVIYVILQQKIIDIEDVINFSLTCRQFNDAFDNSLWKTKLYQSFDTRWPYLKKIYDKRIQNKENINFKDEVKANVNVRKALLSYLSLLSETLFNRESSQPSESDLKNFDILFRPNIGARTMNYHFLKDELLYQIKMSSSHPNLTQQYCSKILLPILQQRHLEDVWLEFINYPKEQQLLENAATILAQWYQPQKRIYDFDIEESLDDIAQQTLNSLKKTHWDHPIFSTSAKQFFFWKYNNIDYNQWSRIEEMQIMNALRTVLFNELRFHLHMPANPERVSFTPISQNIFIDCVLESKTGTDLMLSIIFQSVARRLGVRCDLVCSSGLNWTVKSIAENLGDENVFYINVYLCETTQGRNDCLFENYYHKEICPTVIIFIMELVKDDFIRNHWTWQKSLLLQYLHMQTDELDIIETLYRKYFCDKMSMSHISFSCPVSFRRIQNDYNNRKSVEASRRTEDILRTFEMAVQYMNANLQISRNLIVPKNRTRNMKYAVGMIVTIIKNYPNQTGVIIGWDKKFNFQTKNKCNYSTVLSDSQICDTAQQPFYIILSEDGNVYYAAQDTLIEASPRWIVRGEICRYFCRFKSTYYVPNEALTRHYPYDHNFTKHKTYIY